jgi:hypothetical protein
MRSFFKWRQSSTFVALFFSAFLLGASTVAVAQDLAETVVTIYAKSQDGTSSQGTGFFISRNGRVLTAYHVVHRASEIQIFDFEMTPLKNVSIERLLPTRDLALLKVDASNRPSLSLSSVAPTALTEVRIAGSPRGLPKQTLVGRTTAQGPTNSLALSSATGRRVFSESLDVFPLDITVYNGLSGAPVVSPQGTVVGVLSGSFDEGRGLAWAIPAKYVDELTRSAPITATPSPTFRWPDFRLMAPAWVSLKRSYGRAYDAVHIAKLESLEGAFRRGVREEKLQIYKSDYFGFCEFSGQTSIAVTFSRVDQSEPAITGSFSSTTDQSMRWGYAPNNTEPGRAILHRECKVEPGQPTKRIAFTLKGAVQLESDVDEDEPIDSSGYPSVLDTHDCTGELGQCPAAAFGKSKAGRVEFITPTRIRWQRTILDRVAR